MDLFKKHNGWQAFGYLTWDQFCYDRLQKPVDEVEITITLRRNTQQRAENPKQLNGHGIKGRLDNYQVTDGGTSADYFTARIARDHPDILERMQAGEFKSTRAAAIEAGIVDPSKTPFQVNKDPTKAGRYLAQRVDREWMEAMIDAYYQNID